MFIAPSCQGVPQKPPERRLHCGFFSSAGRAAALGPNLWASWSMKGFGVWGFTGLAFRLKVRGCEVGLPRRDALKFTLRLPVGSLSQAQLLKLRRYAARHLGEGSEGKLYRNSQGLFRGFLWYRCSHQLLAGLMFGFPR